MRFCIAPDAIVPSVDIEHGQITYPSTFAEPLAYGERQSLGSQIVTAPPVPSVNRASTSSRGSVWPPETSVPITSIPAPDAHTPTSQSAATSARNRRTAYGAPEAPVIPRKTRTQRLPSFVALRGLEEGRELSELLVAEPGETRHRRARGLARRAFEVADLEVDSEVLRADVGQIRSAELRAAGVLVRVTVQARGLRQQLRARDCRRVVGKAFLVRPRRHLAHELRRKRLLRRGALVRQDTHRDHDEDRRDDCDGPPREPALAAHIDERQHEQNDQQDRRDANRAEDHRS